MRVAVTGGSGFIGRTVVNELINRGHTFVIADSSSGIDVLSPLLKDSLKGCDVVIHLAGVLGTSELFDTPDEAIDVNVKGTARVLKACADLKMGYVGITMPDVWDNIYQTTRRAAFQLAQAYHRHYNVPIAHVRAFNAYGPHQKVVGVQKIIPTFSVHAWKSTPIPIWGDGNQSVDLIYVEDLAKMLVDATAYGKGEVFDAGTGVSLTVNQVANMVLEITNSPAGQIHHPMRVGEHEVSIVARGDGWDLLGWKPKFCSDAFTKTVEWYREYAL